MGKLVVFVSDRPRGREAKIAYGLQSAGWRVVLLHGMLPTFSAPMYFVETQQYRDHEEALALARRYTPVVYHVFSTWSFDVAAAFIRHKPGKIVFDDYDVVAGMVKETFAEVQAKGIAVERFCLENADGLCCRSLETQYAKRHMGYKYKKRIFFPDYCWNIPDPPVKQSIGEWLNVANVGNLYISQHVPVDHAANCHLYQALRLAEHKVRSFLYLSAACWGTKPQPFLRKVLEGKPNVRFTHVPYEQLIYELQLQCHAGLAFLPHTETPGLESEPYRQTKREHAMVNKVFDYIDAAMPVVMNPQTKFLHWFVKRYHKVIDFAAFMAAPRKQLQGLRAGELFQARKTLSVRRQIGRLIEFYESL